MRITAFQQGCELSFSQRDIFDQEMHRDSRCEQHEQGLSQARH